MVQIIVRLLVQILKTVGGLVIGSVLIDLYKKADKRDSRIKWSNYCNENNIDEKTKSRGFQILRIMGTLNPDIVIEQLELEFGKIS